jgi:hypothetical protein
MALTLTIAGVTKTLRRGTLNISQTANGRASASFDVISTAGTYRPAADAEVILTEGATVIFGGLLERPIEQGLVNGATVGIVTTVSAVDYHAYLERRYINGTFSGGSLESFLDWLVDGWLDVYGVTVHGSQVTGPTLPELTFDYVRADAALNQVLTLTADAGEPYVGRIDNSKVLRAFQPSTSAAPFNITDDTPEEVVGDIVVETDTDYYRNRVIIKALPRTETARVETFTGDGVTDTFTLQYTLTKHYGYVTDDTSTSPVTNDTLTTIEFVGSAAWTYDPSTNTITREAAPLPNGQVMEIKFDGVFAGAWIASDPSATTNPKEIVLQVETAESDATGQAIADAELARRLTAAKKVRYRTHESGLLPGQSQTITVSRRDLAVTATLSDITIQDLGVDILERTVTAVVDTSLTNLGRGFRDDYSTWYGDKAGSTAGITVGDGGTANVGPAAPFTSVQFNDSGAFGGKASFIFYKDQNSVSIGDGSDITAAGFDSCFIAGQNCHITDP